MNSNEFLASLLDSVESFKAAIANEERNGFEFEDTMERKYEEGFIDGMHHAYALLMGSTADAPNSGDVERDTRAAVKGGNCQHDRYSTGPVVCAEHGEYTECYQRRCNNCKTVVEHVIQN